MAKKESKRPKQFIVILLLFLAIMCIAVSYGYFPISIGYNGVEFDRIENTLSEKYDFRGKWRLFSVLRNCSDENKNLNGSEIVYEIQINQKKESELTGEGQKIGEITEGKLMKYKRKTPVLIEGKISHDRLRIKMFEKGFNRELVGVIVLSIKDKRFEYVGYYDGKENNCNGDVKLKR